MQVYRDSSARFGLTVVVDGSKTDADVVDDVHQVFLTITLVPNIPILTSEAASHDGLGAYSVILSADKTNKLGRYTLQWRYRVNNIWYTKTSSFDVVVPYVTPSRFRAEYPELASKTDDEIARKENLARKIIDTFCNQTFDYRLDKTYKVRGNDSDMLYLPERLIALTSVTVNGEDITNQVEIFSDRILRSTSTADVEDIFKFSLFKRDSVYSVRGDWGWDYVPDDIEKACLLLMKDYFTDDYILRQHGILRSSFGDENYTMSDIVLMGTGNLDVDNLLSNYVVDRMWVI